MTETILHAIRDLENLARNPERSDRFSIDRVIDLLTPALGSDGDELAAYQDVMSGRLR